MPGNVHQFSVEGQSVQCHEADGHRLWRCECAYFQRTLAAYNDGFCPHVAVAIEMALRDGTISFDDSSCAGPADWERKR